MAIRIARPPIEAPKSEYAKAIEAFKGETAALGRGALALGTEAVQAVIPDAIEPAGLEQFQQRQLQRAGEIQANLATDPTLQ